MMSGLFAATARNSRIVRSDFPVPPAPPSIETDPLSTKDSIICSGCVMECGTWSGIGLAAPFGGRMCCCSEDCRICVISAVVQSAASDPSSGPVVGFARDMVHFSERRCVASCSMAL